MVNVRGTDGRGRAGGVSVGHLDLDDPPLVVAVKTKAEVPAGYATVQDGVCSELGDDDRDCVVVVCSARVPPFDELKRGKQACEARSAPRGGEPLDKHARGGDGGFSAQGWHADQAGRGVWAGSRHGTDTDRLVPVHALDWESHGT